MNNDNAVYFSRVHPKLKKCWGSVRSPNTGSQVPCDREVDPEDDLGLCRMHVRRYRKESA